MNTAVQKKPGFFIRLVAFYIDQLIICLLVIPLVVSFIYIFRPSGNKSIEIMVIIVSIIITSTYFIILQSSPLKGTFGKLILGMRIVYINEQKLTIVQAALRFFYKYLCFISFGIGFLTIIFRKDKKGIHDILAKTKVYYKNGKNIVVKTIIAIFISLIVISIMFPAFTSVWIYFHTYDEKDCLIINKIAHDMCNYSLPAQFVPYKGMNNFIAQTAVFIRSSTNERDIISFMKTLSPEIKDAFTKINTNTALHVITKNINISSPFFDNYKESILYLSNDKIKLMSFVEFKQNKSFYIIEWNSNNTNYINEARAFFESITIKK